MYVIWGASKWYRKIELKTKLILMWKSENPFIEFSCISTNCLKSLAVLGINLQWLGFFIQAESNNLGGNHPHSFLFLKTWYNSLFKIFSQLVVLIYLLKSINKFLLTIENLYCVYSEMSFLSLSFIFLILFLFELFQLFSMIYL